MKIRMARKEDAKAILSIYAPYILNTTITFEYDVPSLEEFERRIENTLLMYPYLVCEIDGEKVASIKSDQQVKIPVSIGKHKLSFNLWSGNGLYDVDLSENNPKVKVTFKLNMGLITSKPTIIKVENIE